MRDQRMRPSACTYTGGSCRAGTFNQITIEFVLMKVAVMG